MVGILPIAENVISNYASEDYENHNNMGPWAFFLPTVKYNQTKTPYSLVELHWYLTSGNSNSEPFICNVLKVGEFPFPQYSHPSRWIQIPLGKDLKRIYSIYLL